MRTYSVSSCNCSITNIIGAKAAVFRQIGYEVSFLLGRVLYPEVIAMTKELIVNKTTTVDDLRAVWRKFYGTPEHGEQKLGFDDILKQNLFLVDEGQVTFQNRATANFVTEKLKTLNLL
jgi:hypothetical protein